MEISSEGVLDYCAQSEDVRVVVLKLWLSFSKKSLSCARETWWAG